MSLSPHRLSSKCSQDGLACELRMWVLSEVHPGVFPSPFVDRGSCLHRAVLGIGPSFKILGAWDVFCLLTESHCIPPMGYVPVKHA